MLSPRYLAGLSDDLIEIYSQLEIDILRDMARRLARVGKITEATKWQAQVLTEAGGLKQDIARILHKYDKRIVQEIQEIFNDALIKNARADNRIFSEAIGRTISDNNAQMMLTTIKKTHEDLSRLTLTSAEVTNKTFLKQANNAYMQVTSGAFDYDTAMKMAANEIAKNGVTTMITYTNNAKPVRRSLESAVRMNILTGVNQTASQQTMDNCEALDCDLVEVTAHLGARPEHEEWQGKVYSVSGKSEKYPPFSVCGYGEADGICGINCRHSFYPYFEGMEKHYSQDDLDEMSKETVDYNGKSYSRYEGEQQLRHIERTIRHYKKEAAVKEAAGVDNTAARCKIGEWQAKARDFTEQTGIRRDRAREYIGMPNGEKQPKALQPQVVKPQRALEPPPTSTAPEITKDTAPKNTLTKKAIEADGLIDDRRSMTRNRLEICDVAPREVFMLDKPLSSDKIIERVGGGDKTNGSCSSAALAYCANKAGFDVLDFRGGTSRSIFADRMTMSEMAELNGVKSKMISHNNDFIAALSLKKEMEIGKEYYLAIGRHAAIVRKIRDEVFEYLELQENDVVFNSGLKLHVNGFKKLTDDVLKKRFRCTSANKTDDGMRFESLSILIDIESLGKNREFVELMKYINTSENGQLKGQGGYAK